MMKRPFRYYGMDSLSNRLDIPDELWTLEASGQPEEGYGYDVALVIFRILVCVFGVVGNALVIFVIVVLQEYKKAVTHWYVLQLAIADAMFLLTLPFKISEDIKGEWTFSGGVCRAKEALLFLNYYASILFLMVMSIDRYVAVCCSFSTNIQKLRTKRAACIATLIVWIVALLMCIPVISYSNKRGLVPNCKCQYEFPKHDEISPAEFCENQGFESETKFKDCILLKEKKESEELCREINLTSLFELGRGQFSIFSNETSTLDLKFEISTPPENSVSKTTYEMGCSYAKMSKRWFAYLFFNFIGMFVFPFLIMAVCYCQIAFRLKKMHGRRSSVINEPRGIAATKGERIRAESAATVKAEKNRIRVTCICLILVVLFAICWLPFHVVHLAKIKGILGTTEYCGSIAAWTSLIAYLNSALNPYVYNFIGTKFGRRLSSAGRSVKTSVKQRTASLSSAGGTVRYQPRKQSNVGTSTNSATAFTKISRGKNEMEFSHHSPGYSEVVENQALMQKKE